MRQNKKTVSPMSNEGRNQYVVEHITKALLKLMRRQNFSEISISRICGEAGVGRASFYRIFESKETVISRHLKTRLDNWWIEAIQRLSRWTQKPAIPFPMREQVSKSFVRMAPRWK